MYKSKLNNLAQKRKWALPTYACVRTGEAHNPLFSASVMVRGMIFNSPAASKSSKQAHDEAAELAFRHFTSESSGQRSGNVGKTSINEKEVKSSIGFEDIAVNDSAKFDSGKQNGFKKKLQMYAQKKNLDPPTYHNHKDGVFFRAKVSIDEGCFQSPYLCGTMEEAEDSAAQVALLSLSTDAFLENDPRSYKNLLQELAKSEGFFLPMYKTFGSDQEPKLEAFFSTVDVEGEIFKGGMAKSKKLAELDAAKAAYTALIERKLFQPGSFSPSSPDIGIADKLAPHLGSVTISDPGENPISGNEALAQETTAGGNGETGNKGDDDKKSYLLGKRFKVYKSIPNTALPEGTVLLPIREDMWTIVTLEFPGEKDT